MSKWKPNGINDYVGITIDFETGGFNCNECGITEVAVNAFRIKDLKMFDRLHLKIYPYNRRQTGNGKKLQPKDGKDDSLGLMRYEEEALEFCEITMKELYDEGVDIEDAAEQVVSFIERAQPSRSSKNKPFFLGQNITFDLGFFAQLVEYGGVKERAEKALNGTVDYWGNFQPKYVDTMDLAKMAFGDDKLVDKYALSHIAKQLNIPIYDAHDAGADTDATFNVYAVLAGRLRNNSGGADEAIYKEEKERKKFNI